MSLRSKPFLVIAVAISLATAALAQPRPALETLISSLAGTQTYGEVAISPDGTRVACYCKPPPEWSFGLCVVPLAGGLPERTIESSVTTAHSMIRWTPDGKALLVNTLAEDGRNVWRIPLDGSAPQPVTHFTDQLLFAFDFTPDGKALIVSRGELTRDAVMITGFR